MRLQAGYGRLPLYFVEAEGPSRGAISYQMRAVARARSSSREDSALP